MLRKTITLQGKIQGEPVSILVDTSSSVTVLDSTTAKRLGIQGEKMDTMKVKMTYGSCDVRIIPIGGWDTILGVDWLEQYSPIMFDFKKL